MADTKAGSKSVTVLYQLIIAVGAVVVLVFVVDYFFVSNTRAQTAELRHKLEQLQHENQAGSLIKENLRAFEKSLRDSERELDQLKSLLPEAVQISDVLQTIQSKARRQNLILRVFKPGTPSQKDYYTEKPILIDVSGSYRNLGSFFADMASFERINNVSNVEIVETEVQTEKVAVSSSFTVTVYYVSDQNLANLNRGKDQISDGKGRKDKKKEK